MKIFGPNLFKRRLDILLMLLAVLPVLAVGWLAHRFMFDYLRADRIQDVGLVAESRQQQLSAALSRQNDRAESFLSDLANLCGGYEARVNQVCAANLLGSYLTAEGALGATLFRKGSHVITVGASFVQSEQDLRFKPGQVAHLAGTSTARNRAYYIAAAERTADLRLAVAYPASSLQAIFDHSPGVGERGEVVLLDGAGYFVTKPRYAATEGYTRPISSPALQTCLGGANSEMIDADYRGEKTIVGVRPAPELGVGCVSAYVDLEEAFAPLIATEREATAIFVIMLVPIALLALRVARRIAASDESLRKSENQFRFLFESANDTLMVLDLDGNILDINQVGHERLGYDKADMIGRHVSEFDSTEFAPAVPARFAEIRANGNAFFESAHQRRDGIVVPIEINSRLVELDGQQRVFSVVRDIGERKRLDDELRERESLYRAVIETSADGFWIVDMQGRFLEVNDAYVRMSGYRREELLAMRIPDIEAMEQAEETVRHIENVMRDGHDRFESRHRRKDGRVWPVEVVTSYWPIAGGRLFVFVTDITRRKLLEQFTTENERRYRSLFSNLLDGFALFKVITVDGTVRDFFCTEVNEAFRVLTGLQDVIGKTGRKIIPGIREQNPEAFEALSRVVQGGKPERFEIYLKQLQKWYVVSVYSPEEGYVVIMFDDISERKYFEQMVSTRLDFLTRQANDIILLTDRQGRIVDANDRAIETYGYSVEEFAALSAAALYAPEFAQTFEARQSAIFLAGALRFDSVHARKNGACFPVEVSTRVIEIGKEAFIQSIVRDISERKQSEQLLLEKERRLAEAQHLAKVGSWEWNAVTGTIHWSDELYRIFGFAAGQALPPYEDYLQLYAPKSRALFSVAVEQARYAGQVTECDLELAVQNGAPRWVFARFEPTHDANGAVTGIRGTVQDITERKRQEELMRAASREIHDLYNNAPCGYHSLDKGGVIVSVNHTELAWLGYRRAEVVGKKRLTDFLTPRSTVTFNETFPKLKAQGRTSDIELEFVRKDGTVLPVLVSATAVRDDSGNFLMTRSTVFDMTERKKMEEERSENARRLQKLSQRMVAAQELERRWLASELHDRSGANLAAISLNCKNLRAKLPPPLQKEVGTLLEDTQALVADTTANIREVCANLRPDVLDRAGFWRALEGYAQQYSRRTGISVYLEQFDGEQHFSPNIRSTLFRITQEALTNTAKHSQASEIRIGLRKEGDSQTVLAISDNGRGFDREDFADGGTVPGLGLVTMQERAEFIGGKFTYETAPGRGMHIRVELEDNA